MSPTPTRPVARARATLAATARHHPDDAERIAVARRDLRAENLAEHITRVVEAAPPLTPEQRDRLAALLRPSTSADPGPEAASDGRRPRARHAR
jgi:hypothetical protein